MAEPLKLNPQQIQSLDTLINHFHAEPDTMDAVAHWVMNHFAQLYSGPPSADIHYSEGLEEGKLTLQELLSLKERSRRG